MKIRRIPKEEDAGFCHDCHSKAGLEIIFGGKRPNLRLCMRDGRYLGGVILSRIGEAEQGIPIPKPGERIPGQRVEEEGKPMIAILAGIIVVVVAIGAGFAILMGALTLLIGALNLLCGIGQIVVEGALWLVYWLLELEVRKTWRPWQHWRVGFDGYIDSLDRWENWLEKRRQARRCIHCYGLKRTKPFGTHYAHERCERMVPCEVCATAR